jgi:drug/metabolite transporter (DMT)-like permease
VLAIVLAIGSSLAWGVSDFLGGLKGRSVDVIAVLLISQATSLLLVFALVAVSGAAPPEASFLAFAALAGISESVGVAALYLGLARATMSIVAPVAATAPLVPVLVSGVTGQLPGPVQAAAIALVAAGMILASCGGGGSDVARPAAGASVGYGLLAALGFGCFYVAMDAASDGEIPWALLVARVTAVALIATVALLMRRRPHVESGDLPAIALIGVLIVAADSMYAVASTHGLLSVVGVLSSLYPVVTIGLARVYLKEQVAPRQRAGIAAVLAGVLVVAAT